MRSRYVAYVRQRADYLLRTWHSTTRPEALEFSTDGGQWLAEGDSRCGGPGRG